MGWKTLAFIAGLGLAVGFMPGLAELNDLGSSQAWGPLVNALAVVLSARLAEFLIHRDANAMVVKKAAKALPEGKIRGVKP